MKLLTNLAVEKLELQNFQLSGASFLAQDNIDGGKKNLPKKPLPETNSKRPLKNMGHPSSKLCHSNHPFSGASAAVSFREKSYSFSNW